MHRNGSSHSSGCSVLATSRLMRSLTAVMFLLHQMVSGPESHQVGIVGRCWYAHRSGAPYVGVAELISETLKLIALKMVVVPEYVIMGRSGSALDTLVTAQVKVKFSGMSNTHIYSGASRNVSTFSALFLFVSTEKSSVMALLHYDKSDSRPVVRLKFYASLANRSQFVLENVEKLALGHGVTVKDNTMGFVATGALVEHNEQLTNHGTEFLNDLLAVLLHADSGGVARGMGVHATNHRSDARLLVVAGWGMGHVGTEEYHRLVKDFRTNTGDQDAVDTAKLDVDL